MIRRFAWFGLLLLTAVTAYAGGLPILTISKMPDYFVVGRTDTLVFVVRAICCENGPLTGRSYTVRATTPGQRELSVPAIPTGNPGEYTASLSLIAAGDWTVTVSYDYSGLLTSPPLHRKAVLSGNRVPDALSLEARGERNFAEKGCVNCHVDQEIPAPDLTGRKFAEEYLVMFLANPASVKKDARMPNLNLTTDDISALAAFINRERPPIRTVSQVAK